MHKGDTFVTIVYFVFKKLVAEFTTPLLCFDNGLIAGPEEIFLADGFDESAALHHLFGVVVDSSKHQHAALFLQPFVQVMNGFDAGGIYERDAAHG